MWKQVPSFNLNYLVLQCGPKLLDLASPMGSLSSFSMAEELSNVKVWRIKTAYNISELLFESRWGGYLEG